MSEASDVSGVPAKDEAALEDFRARFAACIARPRPVFETARLQLRPYRLDDASQLQRLAGDRRVAATTATIPHPYPDGAAEAWIAPHDEQWSNGSRINCAIETREGDYVGGVGLVFERDHARAELGYWIAVPAWGKGYATEASEVLCDFGFTRLGLHKIEARYLATNTASGRVMAKLGMQREAVLRQHVVKWNERHDLVVCGILAAEWHAHGRPRGDYSLRDVLTPPRPA